MTQISLKAPVFGNVNVTFVGFFGLCPGIGPELAGLPVIAFGPKGLNRSALYANFCSPSK